MHIKIILLSEIVSPISFEAISIEPFFIASFKLEEDLSIPTIFLTIFFFFSASPKEEPIRPGPIMVIFSIFFVMVLIFLY